MKNKKISKIIPIVLMVLALILIISALIISKINKKNTNKPSSDNNPTNSQNITLYTCKLKLEQDNQLYDSYQVETLSVLDGVVLNSTPSMVLYCKSEDVYLELKNDETYSKDKKFNDSEKSITFSNGSTVDLTRDSNGNEFVLKYDNYQKDLATVGYECSKK